MACAGCARRRALMAKYARIARERTEQLIRQTAARITGRSTAEQRAEGTTRTIPGKAGVSAGRSGRARGAGNVSVPATQPASAAGRDGGADRIQQASDSVNPDAGFRSEGAGGSDRG